MNRSTVVLPLVLVVTVLGALGQTLIKRAVNSAPVDVRFGSLIAHLLWTPSFYAGVLVTGAGTLTWLFVLSRAQLSYATPFAGIGIVVVMISSALVLGEPVGPLRVAGTLVIAVGTALVVRG